MIPAELGRSHDRPRPAGISRRRAYADKSRPSTTPTNCLKSAATRESYPLGSLRV